MYFFNYRSLSNSSPCPPPEGDKLPGNSHNQQPSPFGEDEFAKILVLHKPGETR
jgi:hypothetical protein